MISTVIKRTLNFFCKLAILKFEKQLKEVKATQKQTLRNIIQLHVSTEYAQAHQLKENDGYKEFAAKIPVVDYHKIQPWLAKDRSHFSSAIVPEFPSVWERTSGSSGAFKEIPYTPSLMRSFHQALKLWASDLIANGPEFKTGQIFFSLSTQFKITEDNSPHSFSDDRDYLPPLFKKILGLFFIVPPQIKKLQDPHLFKLYLLAYLVNEEKLETIFVWSPTYLLSLMEFLDKNRSELIDLIRAQTFTYNNIVFKVPPIRAKRLKQLSTFLSPMGLWPHLRFISCWTDGSSAFFLPQIQKLFPGVYLQPKGLLATEVPMTIPWLSAPGPVPLLQEVFFEFIDGDGQIQLLHELSVGKTYEIIISQKGGLLRYRTFDSVKVVGVFKNTPCFIFMGRTDCVSDLVGEKMNEEFVTRSIGNINSDADTAAFLLPIQKASEKPHYLCITNSDDPEYSRKLDLELQKSAHYNEARQQGQLAQLKSLRVSDPTELYFNYYLSKGMTWGDIKYTHLIKSSATAEQMLSQMNLS